MPADQQHLRALAEQAQQLRAGIRHGRPPEQRGSVSYDERRRQSPTGHLWPIFLSVEG